MDITIFITIHTVCNMIILYCDMFKNNKNSNVIGQRGILFLLRKKIQFTNIFNFSLYKKMQPYNMLHYKYLHLLFV